MKTTGNTILITGGGSGIGRALGEAFQRLGNRIIIAGRAGKSVDDTLRANPNMTALTVDMADADSIRSLAANVMAKYPDLNVVVNMAGIMRPENVLDQKETLSDAEATVLTNLLGPIRLTAALLPLLQKQPAATVLMVSSGLAFIPRADTPTYCATKAAIHSYAESLRFQLKNTSVEVLELVPPYVATRLMGEQQANDPEAMPLDAFIAEAMEIMTTQPDATEILVEKVYPLRYAAHPDQDKYQEMFKKFNTK